MAVHDYVIADATTPVVRADINNALSAIVTNNSSATAPSPTFAGMLWFDTTNNQLKMRDGANANFIIIGELDVTNSRFKLQSNELKAASAAGIDILNSSGTKIIDLEIASEATAKAGTNNTELMTPLRVRQASPILPGMIFPYGGTSAPSEYLLCFGQSVSTSTYADLHGVIGYTYGGSGSSFTIPDLRGRVVAGQDDMGGSSANRLTSPINGDTLGAAGGTESHTLTEAELASHTHFIASNTGDTSTALSASNFLSNKGNFGSSNNYILAGVSGGAQHGKTSSTGSGTAHNNVQPTFILNYIIKT
jgi:microcystin-dependent protein